MMKFKLWLVPAVVLFMGCAHTREARDPLATHIHADMMYLSDADSARVSSWDRSGGNVDARPIVPGETLELAAIPGAGVIRHIYFTIIGPVATQPHYLQDLVLRMYWDGEIEPSVEVPFGDFFGQGYGRINFFRSQLFTVNEGGSIGDRETTLTVGFNCYFPMPFSDAARLTLTNEGATPVTAAWYHIDYEGLDALSANVCRFHAQFRQERPATPVGDESNFNACSFVGTNLDGAENYVILEAEGQGNFVGYFLNVDNVVPVWYGEGDDMIFIDGEDWPPSFHGTGSEEIFGGGACPNIPYTGPYTGYLRIDNKDFSGKNSSYRFYVTDPIRFKKSIRATIEHGHANNFANHYSSVAFWYQTEPHAPFPKLPSVVERLPRDAALASRAIPENAVLIGVEDGDVAMTPGWGRFFSRACFDTVGYWVKGGAGNETFRWNIPEIERGTYEVFAWIPDDANKDHAADAPYTVQSAAGRKDARIDQSKEFEAWRTLGRHELDKGSFVQLSNRANGNVVADAVLLVPSPEEAHAKGDR